MCVLFLDMALPCTVSVYSGYLYNDVIMDAMASQITSHTIVYSTVYSGTDQRKHQSSASLAFVRVNSPVTGEFPAQRASNAQNVSIWRRRHEQSFAHPQSAATAKNVLFVSIGYNFLYMASEMPQIWLCYLVEWSWLPPKQCIGCYVTRVPSATQLYKRSSFWMTPTAQQTVARNHGKQEKLRRKLSKLWSSG